MKRITAVILAILGMAFPGAAVAAGTIVKGNIESNTTWEAAQGPYWVTGNVTVEKGAVLTVKAGTQVRLYPNVNIVVKGGLEAEGGEGNPAAFTAADGKAWGSLFFYGSDPKHSLLRRCVVAGGRVACVGASPVIEQCSLYGSANAVQVGENSAPRIVGNRITANTVGLSLTADTASPLATKNVIYDNRYGVYFERFGAPQVSGNLIYANRAYNMVNRSPKTVAAPWNDFRAADAASIAKTIYDGALSAGVGRVNFMPYKPVEENKPERIVVVDNGYEAFQPRLSLTLSGMAAQASGLRVPSAQRVGLGNLARLDYQFRPFMSIGVNAGYAAFMGNGKVSTVGQLDLTGRIIPVRIGAFEPYLTGAAGVNPLYNRDTTPWVGHYHAMAGVGARVSLDPAFGLDLSGAYDFYTPMAFHVDSFSVRVGVSYGVGL